MILEEMDLLNKKAEQQEKTFASVIKILNNFGSLSSSVDATIKSLETIFDDQNLTFDKEFLEAKLKCPDAINKQAIPLILIKRGFEGDIELLLELLNESSIKVKQFALRAIGQRSLSSCPEQVKKLLKSTDDNIRLEAIRTVCFLDDPETLYLLLTALSSEFNPSISLGNTDFFERITKIPANKEVMITVYSLFNKQKIKNATLSRWVKEAPLSPNEKLDAFIDFTVKFPYLDDFIYTPLYYSIAYEKDGSVNTEILFDQVIENIIKKSFEPRVKKSLSRLISELLGGGQIGSHLARELIEGKLSGLSPTAKEEKMKLEEFYRFFPKPNTNDDLVGKLQQGFQNNYVDVAAKLTERTMREWETTVGQAKSGFTARLWMNIVMFSLGVVLTISGIIFMFTSNSSGMVQLFGTGVSLIAGVATMGATLFFGPLREIARSVADVGVLNTSLIGYIHRVLQISHTFEYLYLTQKISLEQLETMNNLIDKSNQATATNLFNLIQQKRRD